MKNAHVSLIPDWVGAVGGAAFGVCLLESVLAGQRITVTPFIKMEQTSPNGP